MREQPQHVTVDGAIHGDYFLEEERADGSVLLRPAPYPPYPAVLPTYPRRAATDAELAQFESEHGPFLPPDGEG